MDDDSIKELATSRVFYIGLFLAVSSSRRKNEIKILRMLTKYLLFQFLSAAVLSSRKKVLFDLVALENELVLEALDI